MNTSMTTAFSAGLLLSAVGLATTSEARAQAEKPLSEIIRSVEDQRLGAITEVDYDDGFWEVEVPQGRYEDQAGHRSADGGDPDAVAHDPTAAPLEGSAALPHIAAWPSPASPISSSSTTRSSSTSSPSSATGRPVPAISSSS
jgi:hypothetical protein